MKLLRIIPFLALLMLWSCGDQEKEADEEVVVEEEMVNPDEVISQWEQAWSSNQPQNVKDQMSGDAVLVMNGEQFPKDSLASWVDMAGSGMKDLQMTSLQKGSSDGIIYDSGTFSHNVRENDTLHFEGTYTFIWEKAEGSDEWKIALMDISDARDDMDQPEED